MYVFRGLNIAILALALVWTSLATAQSTTKSSIERIESRLRDRWSAHFRTEHYLMKGDAKQNITDLDSFVGLNYKINSSDTIKFRQQLNLARTQGPEGDREWDAGYGAFTIEYTKTNLFNIAGRDVYSRFRLYTPTGEKNRANEKGTTEFRYYGIWSAPLNPAAGTAIDLIFNPRFYGYTKDQEPGDKRAMILTGAEVGLKVNKYAKLAVFGGFVNYFKDDSGLDDKGNPRLANINTSAVEYYLYLNPTSNFTIMPYVGQERNLKKSGYKILDGEDDNYYGLRFDIQI